MPGESVGAASLAASFSLVISEYFHVSGLRVWLRKPGAEGIPQCPGWTALRCGGRTREIRPGHRYLGAGDAGNGRGHIDDPYDYPGGDQYQE